MRKKIVLIICIMIWVLTGCSKKENAVAVPKYFEPIIERLEADKDEYVPIMTDWWIESVDFTDKYDNKIYTCSIEGKEYSFNLEKQLTSAMYWEWMTAGIFRDAENGKMNVCLHNSNITYEDETKIPNPQLLLIEFDINNPDKYEVWSYNITPPKLFGWDVICYGINDNIYIAEEKELGLINVSTKQFSYCRDEYSSLEHYVQKKYVNTPYYMFYFRAVSESDGLTIYSAQISEADDTPPVGMVYMAYQDGGPISYMLVDLTNDDIIGGMAVEVVEKQ